MSLSAVNFWAVLAAAVAAWLAGTGYYTVLAEPWARALGTNTDHLRRERAARAGTLAAWFPFLLVFVAELVMAFVLAVLMREMDITGPRGGALTGALAWLGLVATTNAVANMFADRKIMLTIIDTGHWLLALLVMGGVLGWFG
ncbi:DUF1761 domain-containing protein [Xanthobacteraceae bacterium Astr-EGSB]|uniref:DUF1761 domain-containing protein n=1 Tax=Astrobacterium formosum TaxID=3069710 RepID=UPI0027B47474|nr:DUF1761 domain-containing protein [Xanthobacteraceae bacterium Astr-EGSB]